MKRVCRDSQDTSSSDALEHNRASLTATDARRADRVPLIQAVERVDEVVRDTSSRGGERVAECCE